MMMNCTTFHGDFHPSPQDGGGSHQPPDVVVQSQTHPMHRRLCVQIPEIVADPTIEDIEEFLKSSSSDYQHHRSATTSMATPTSSPGGGGYMPSLNASPPPPPVSIPTGIGGKSFPVPISPMSSPPAGGPLLHQAQEVPSSILREALTKPNQQPTSHSCPSAPTPLAALHEAAEEEGRAEMDTFPTFDFDHPRGGVTGNGTVENRPKYNFDAIKNYPPFRDVYNAVRARSRSAGRGAATSSGSRPRSTSESSTSSIKCSRCNQVLTSKCLVQRCHDVSEQTKCKTCGSELTMKCLLSNCTTTKAEQ